MADYQQMYLELFRAVTKAINLLEHAQQTCEDLYISAPEVELRLLGEDEPKKP